MTLVLGVYWFPYDFSPHESSACLVEDGRILAAIEEDRITRVKHESNRPVNAVMEVFRIAKRDPTDVDAVAIPWRSPFKRYLSELRARPGIGSIASYPAYRSRLNQLKDLVKWLGVDGPVYCIDHHLSHAAAAYFSSGFPDSTVITVDGLGDDYESTVVWNARGDELEKVGASHVDGSFGMFYETATQALGFKPMDGEGKTMGLAAHGTPDAVLYEKISNFISVNGARVHGRFSEDHTYRLNLKDHRPFSLYRHVVHSNNPFVPLANGYRKEDIAYNTQIVLEEKACDLVKAAVRKTGRSRVCLGGGVALNVKMNKRIRELSEVDEVFVFPNPADPGTCVGAAQMVCRIIGRKCVSEPMEHTYYGTGYSNDEIEEALDSYEVAHEKLEDPAIVASELIADGRVVGWFQGQLEFGPRALGNRSILAGPRDPSVKDRINKILKRRDWFMPFAPSILDEAKLDFLRDAEEAPFMIMAFDSLRQEDIPAVVHVDGSVRPQTVKRNVNPRFWKVIDAFRERTGLPVVLNTSFNRHGLPMIRSPQDALDHFLWGCVDSLIIGDYLVQGRDRLETSRR